MFSIIIPVYNAEIYLRQCLDSVLVQTCQDWECICGDDGSTDGSGMILDEYARRDERFRIIHQKNGGEGAARNAGIFAARGLVVAWVDADDFMDPCVLSEVVDVFSREDVDMVRVRHKRFRGDACEMVPNQKHECRRIHGRNAVRTWALDNLTWAGYCWVTFVKRAKFSKKFPIGVQYAADALFMLLNVCGLDSIAQSEFVGYYYRDTPTSIMKKPFPSKERVQFFTLGRSMK